MTNVTPGSQEQSQVFYTDNGFTVLIPVTPGTPLPTTATISGDVNVDVFAEATAAAPTYIEATEDFLSQTLKGGLRVTPIIGTTGVEVALATSTLQSSVQSAAGTPNTTAVTIQGNASGVPVIISGTVTETAPAATTITTAQVTVPATVNGIQILATNASRKGASIYNPGSVNVYIAQTNAVTTSSGFIPPFATYTVDFPNYTGAIFGIVGTGTQIVSTTELT